MVHNLKNKIHNTGVLVVVRVEKLELSVSFSIHASLRYYSQVQKRIEFRKRNEFYLKIPDCIVNFFSIEFQLGTR